MKFGMRILDTKLQIGIENQSITIKGSICNICRIAILENKTTRPNRMKFGTRIHETKLK